MNDTPHRGRQAFSSIREGNPVAPQTQGRNGSPTRAAAATWRMIGAYVLAYCAASALDIWSTVLALQRPGASEKNIFVTDGGGFDPLTGIFVTALGGCLLVAIFTFGLINAGKVSARWLDQPRASFFTGRALSLIPWSPRAIDRAPLQYLAFALALPVLRVLAGLNNLLISQGFVGPIGWAVRSIGSVTTPAVGFILVGGGLYFLLAVLLAPNAAMLVRSLR